MKTSKYFVKTCMFILLIVVFCCPELIFAHEVAEEGWFNADRVNTLVMTLILAGVVPAPSQLLCHS